MAATGARHPATLITVAAAGEGTSSTSTCACGADAEPADDANCEARPNIGDNSSEVWELNITAVSADIAGEAAGREAPNYFNAVEATSACRAD